MLRKYTIRILTDPIGTSSINKRMVHSLCAIIVKISAKMLMPRASHIIFSKDINHIPDSYKVSTISEVGKIKPFFLEQKSPCIHPKTVICFALMCLYLSDHLVRSQSITVLRRTGDDGVVEHFLASLCH